MRRRSSHFQNPRFRPGPPPEFVGYPRPPRRPPPAGPPIFVGYPYPGWRRHINDKDQVTKAIIEETVKAAERRIPRPRVRPGRAVDVSAGREVMVLMDGDTEAIIVESIVGPLALDDRVMVMFNPPSGALAVGVAPENTDTAWHDVDTELGFANGWVNDVAPIEFRRETNGVVRMRGVMQSGADASTAFTLPEGFRPLQSIIQSQYGSYATGGEGATRVNISTAGVVTPRAGAGLSGVCNFFTMQMSWVVGS